MAGNTFGTYFKITTWGESHGKAVGVVVDGCPAGVPLCEEDIQFFLDRRKPGQSAYTTQRNEDDKVEILSGIFEGKTTGTPISMVIFNKDQRSHDYSQIAACYRPGHADYGFDEKYGARPLKRAIQTKVEDALAQEILEGKVKAGDKVLLGVSKEEIKFSVKSEKALDK